MKLGPLCRAPAALARHQLEAVARRADDDRLEHSAFSNRRSQLDERIFVEMAPRLRWIGTDPANLDLANRGAGGPCIVARGGTVVDQRAQPAPQPHRLLHAAAAGASSGKRETISRASLI